MTNLWFYFTKPLRRRVNKSPQEIAHEIEAFSRELKSDYDRLVVKKPVEEMTIIEAMRYEDEMHRFYFKYIGGR